MSLRQYAQTVMTTGGAEGHGAASSSAEGNGAEGNGAEGNGAEGNGAEGNGAEGNGAEGNGAEGNGAEGNGAEGNGAEGNGAASNGAAGSSAEGNGAEGSSAEGNNTAGGVEYVFLGLYGDADPLHARLQSALDAGLPAIATESVRARDGLYYRASTQFSVGPAGTRYFTTDPTPAAGSRAPLTPRGTPLPLLAAEPR
jgi:hypothetical protein